MAVVLGVGWDRLCCTAAACFGADLNTEEHLRKVIRRRVRLHGSGLLSIAAMLILTLLSSGIGTCVTNAVQIFAGVRYLLPALIVMTPWVAGAVDPVPQGLWGGQAVADTSEWGYNPFSHSFALSYDLVLRHGRFPLVVYNERANSGYSLKSVEWQDGTRKEQTIFSLDSSAPSPRLAAQGDRVSMVWSMSGALWHSLRENGVWSPAESVVTGASSWDVEMTPSGTPVIAITVPGPQFSDTSKIRLLVRGVSGWTGSDVASINNPTTKAELTLDPSGEPTVAWHTFTTYSGGPPSQAQYARREGGQWIKRNITGAQFLGALLNDGSGAPCAIVRDSSSSVSSFVSLAQPGAPLVPISTIGGEVSDATTSPDGTIHAIRGDSLMVRRDGVWSEAPCLWSQKVVAGSDGTVHFLGEKFTGMLNYGTLLAGDPIPMQQLTTYEDGSAVFDDVVMHPDGQPRAFGWLNGTRKYSGTGNTWSYQTVPTIGFDWLHAFDRSGKLHAFAGYGAYAIEQNDGTMAVSNLPVSGVYTTSSFIYDFLLDGADVPTWDSTPATAAMPSSATE
jgi:hypothetical protein